MALTVLLLGFATLLLAGVPVAFSFLAGSLAYLFIADTPLTIAAQQLSGGVRSVTLLAIPLYILAGELLNSGGIADRIFNFANALIGHVRGGLGHVNVMASMLFAGMSGSSSADAAGLGRVEIKAMLEKGYRPEFAAAITAVSSTIGPIIPPSIHLVLFGAMAEIGIDYLFLAGIVPGFIMGACLMAAIYILVLLGHEQCPTQSWPGARFVFRTFQRAILPLTAPVIIVGGILAGVFTPTEAGAVAVIYALALGYIYGELDWPRLKEALLRSVRSTVVVMFILATAKVFAWGITVEKVPDILALGLFTLSSDPAMVLLLILVGLLILGTFESASANLVIVTPILVPMAPALGIDVVHFGVVIVLALMIGIITPPVGMSLYIVSDITKLPFERIAKAVLPYTVALVVALLLTAYLPDVVMFIPKFYGYKL
ncbi:MAG: TRAP transporter large permease [Rhodocyclaceae bacterium]|nr:TRAP transporter large permease [Rhodocyclaceae bacterium]